MVILILSDLHIGDPRTGATGIKIANMLDEKKFDILILNGDIFDLWFEKDIDVFNQYFITKKLKNLALTKQIYWVRGNHDYNADSVSCLLPGVPIVNSVDLLDSGHKIRAIHGHQVYRFENRTWYNKLLAKINLIIERIFGVDIQRSAQKTRYYRSSVRKKRAKIISKFGNGVDYIVSGHTHLIGYCYHNDVQLYDMGSTAFTKTYAEIIDGDIHLRQL